MPKDFFGIPPKAWSRYKNIVNNFIDKDSGRQPILWLRKINQMLAYGEDNDPIYQPVAFEGLMHYNYILSWPIRYDSESGAIDKGNNVLYVSANLLRNNGYLNSFGYWDYNWAEDKFVVNGKVYKIGTDTQVAQANDQALLFFVVLYRCEEQEQEDLLNQYGTAETQVVTPDGVWLVDSEGKTIRDICRNPLRIEKDSKFKCCCKNG